LPKYCNKLPVVSNKEGNIGTDNGEKLHGVKGCRTVADILVIE